MSWLYGEPVTGDIADYRMVHVDFCVSSPAEYIMHKDHVGRFVEAAVKLHHTPGINPANNVPTARIWKITSAPLHGAAYWWSTPSLERNDDPAGAVIVKSGRTEQLFIDREYVDRIYLEECRMESAEAHSHDEPASPEPSQEA